MAITRAQQYRQMLENGGRGISLQEAKDMAPKGEFLAYINKKEAKMLKDAGGSGIMTNAGIPSFKSAVVKSLLVSEDAGSGSTITITLVNASGAIFNLFKDKAIASKATTELLTQPLVMEESEILKVQAADANELHVIASILEIQPREVTA